MKSLLRILLALLLTPAHLLADENVNVKDENQPETVEEDVKENDEAEAEVEEEVEEIQEMPKLKSEILAGLVDHMKGLKKEDLANLYGKTVLGEEDEEEEDDEDEDEEEEMESKKVAKESIDQVVDSLDVSDDVNALVDGEELSEEFKTKAATIFESAVKTKVRAELEKIQEQNDQLIEEMAESTINDMTEKVDDYLNYVVEQWMEENQLAIERGLKGEIAEDFISGLKNLFEDHYIDVPDEKYDILEANLTKIEELEEKLRSNPFCYLTGEKIDLMDSQAYSLDHIMPKSRGGDNSIDNCGLTTKRANQMKPDMTVDEFLNACKTVLNHHGYKVEKI